VRKEEKTQYVDELREAMKGSQIVLRTRYSGLNVAKMSALRKQLSESGVRYKVVRNTLLRRAVEGTDYEPLVRDLKGPIALAFTEEDAVATAKVLTDFAKGEEVFSIDIGVLDGKELSAAQIQSLASLPGKDQLRAQLLSLLQTVPQRLLGVLQAPARDMVGVIEARRKNLDEAGA
jgi:large subunit ribosomal protein L10